MIEWKMYSTNYMEPQLAFYHREKLDLGNILNV